MPGFMSSKTAMSICHVDSPARFDVDALRKGAFSDAINPDGFRFGWTGLGELLDFDNFFLATCDNRFHGFSFRLDSRKAPAAVVRLLLAEKIMEEEAAGKKVGSARKKELREIITDKLISQTEFVPQLVDCIWDSEKDNLLVATVSERILELVLEHFRGCFHMDAKIIEPQKDMPGIFSTLQQANGLELADWFLQPMGTANLVSEPSADEKSSIAVQNSVEAVTEALNKGLEINKLCIVATNRGNGEEQRIFTINSMLQISGLELPKAEKNADEDATFLINATLCADVAAITGELSQ